MNRRPTAIALCRPVLLGYVNYSKNIVMPPFCSQIQLVATLKTNIRCHAQDSNIVIFDLSE